jgi:UDP-N-acetylenolpyruvoylglucosamine reductase
LASSKDMLDLMAHVQEEVYKKTQVHLVSEVVYIPFNQRFDELSS